MVLGNLTDLCLNGYKKAFQENKEFGSRSDRRLTQVGTELKGFFSRMGYAAWFVRLIIRGSRIFISWERGGVQAQLTHKKYFYAIIYILVLNYWTNGLFPTVPLWIRECFFVKILYPFTYLRIFHSRWQFVTV